MRILILGGTGLIGSAIARRLVERGDEVSVFSRGLAARELPNGCLHISGDRRQPEFSAAARTTPSFDAVIDMVCYQPSEARTALRAFSGRTGQYLLTSTVDVYRKPATRYPCREDEPLNGIGEYATKKVLCERIIVDAYERAGFPATIIRPAATYGDRHPPVHSLGRSTTYLDRLRRGKPIVQHGDGSSFWVSCHADDVATAFVGALGNPKAIGSSYHVTGEEWVTWDQHHAILASAIDAPQPRIVHIPTDALVAMIGERAKLARDNLQFNSIFDNSRAREDLGFRYTIPLRVGLPDWYASLDAAGMIQDSDADPFDDQLIERWHARLGES